MKCPVCETMTLDPRIIDGEPMVLACTTCSGTWLQSYQYWLWKERHADEDMSIPPQGTPEDVLKPKKCPECSHHLSRYTVGHGTTFSIDRCERCRGIWFDKNEWETIRGSDLHDQIHFIFSSHWQHGVRQEKLVENRARALEREIGSDRFKTVQEFRKWLGEQKEKISILAWLNQLR